MDNIEEIAGSLASIEEICKYIQEHNIDKKGIIENRKFQEKLYKELGESNFSYSCIRSVVEDIEQISNETVRYQRYAGRFAAKEAIYKSLSKVLTKEEFSPSFLDVEVLNDEEFKRRPYINVVNKTLDDIFVKYKIKIDLSISHVRENAIAMAVANIEKE